MLRHYAAYLDGQDLDPESNQPHTAHIAACMLILLDAEATGNLVDDRPTAGKAAEMLETLSKVVIDTYGKTKEDCLGEDAGMLRDSPITGIPQTPGSLEYKVRPITLEAVAALGNVGVVDEATSNADAVPDEGMFEDEAQEKADQEEWDSHEWGQRLPPEEEVEPPSDTEIEGEDLSGGHFPNYMYGKDHEDIDPGCELTEYELWEIQQSKERAKAVAKAKRDEHEQRARTLQAEMSAGSGTHY